MYAAGRVAVILAPEGDIHARTVAWEVAQLGGEAIILDTAGMPGAWQLSMRYGLPSGACFSLTTPDGRVIEDEQMSGLWLRRREAPIVPAEVTDLNHRAFCEAESRALLDGWLYALGRRAINPLDAELRCRRKAYQLHLAATLGLAAPDTLITNDPAAARAIATDGKAALIYKILTNTPWQFTETRPLATDHLAAIDSLCCAPVIFQRRIGGGPDIRVTIIDDRLFPVEICPRHPEAWLDWRLDLAAEFRPHDLPSAVAERLLTFHGAMGLRYGAYDLRLDATGEYVFFEVNQGGQYLFVEIHTGLPISRALASALLGG